MRLVQGRTYMNKELAEWFGITPRAFNNSKEKKLEELKHFADFTFVGKRVYIKKVYVEEYTKKWQSIKHLVVNNIDQVWNKNGIDTAKRVGLTLKRKLDLDISDGTAQRYARDGRTELYGKPFVSVGKLGRCKFVWCKKEGDGADAVLEPLSKEQEELKRNLYKKYFGSVEDQQVFVKAMVEKGEIKKEQAWGVLEELTNMGSENYMAFLQELRERLGSNIIKGTLVERFNELGFFDDENDENDDWEGTQSGSW